MQGKWTIIYNEGQGFTERKAEYPSLVALIREETAKKILSNNAHIYHDDVRVHI